MQKKEVVLIFLSVFFLLGASCQSQTEVKSLSECTSLENIDARVRCSDNYYLQNAVEQGDSSLCINIINTNMKESCQKQVSNSLNDPEKENLIISPEQQGHIPLDESNNQDINGGELPPIPTE